MLRLQLVTVLDEKGDGGVNVALREAVATSGAASAAGLDMVMNNLPPNTTKRLLVRPGSLRPADDVVAVRVIAPGMPALPQALLMLNICVAESGEIQSYQQKKAV
jgi:hypothetical protein